MTREPIRLPLAARLQMLLRLLFVQASWNYESMLGTGIGFALEPALRMLPGGRDGKAYRDAVARQSAYFNAHPYLAALAVGALARAELDGESHERISRFRTALCGPLGSLGDRLVWAGLLPVCSLIALAMFGLGAGPVVTVISFLVLYNAGHLALRVWGLEAGLKNGLAVSRSIGAELTQKTPQTISAIGALLTGAALPLVLQRLTGSGVNVTAIALGAAVVGALALGYLPRVRGWLAALVILAAYVLFAVIR